MSFFKKLTGRKFINANDFHVRQLNFNKKNNNLGYKARSKKDQILEKALSEEMIGILLKTFAKNVG
jgi:hypothetical protein